MDLLSSTSKLSLCENEIDLVITGSATPDYLLLNKAIMAQIIKKGFFKINVYQDTENKVLAFNFGKTGDITAVSNTDPEKKRGALRLTNKKLIKFMCEFFGINPAIKCHNKLIISNNKANSSEMMMFYVRKSIMECVNLK